MNSLTIWLLVMPLKTNKTAVKPKKLSAKAWISDNMEHIDDVGLIVDPHTVMENLFFTLEGDGFTKKADERREVACIL